MAFATALVLAVLYNAVHSSNLGDVCTVSSTDKQGLCKSLVNCDYARVLIEDKKEPQSCGVSGRQPLVCCPLQPNYKNFKPGTLTRAMCGIYNDPRRRTDNTFIDLGAPASPREFPHMAAIGYGENKANIVWLCGGSLISQRYVLTAAHCIDAGEFGLAKWVRLGDLDLQNTTEDAKPTDLQIKKVLVHPLYKGPSHYHDIALFKLESKVSHFASVYFRPACLHTFKEIPGVTLEVTGWGQQGVFGDPSSHLLKANLTLVAHQRCASKYSDAPKRKLKNGILDEYQICAGDEEGRDTCPGDSGGPLHYRVQTPKPHFVVAGITSFGKGCGGPSSVGVYTRVSAYIEWIESNIWPEKSIFL